MFITILALTGMLTGLGGLILSWYALTMAREAGSETRAMAARTAAVNAGGVDPCAVRDVAVLHYDALEEMSGARSFSLAMLNSGGDGVVVTSINGRTESRTYAKAITRGDADTLLSPEEYRVIRSARLGAGVGSPVPSPPVPPPENSEAGGAPVERTGTDAEAGSETETDPEADADAADGAESGADTGSEADASSDASTDEDATDDTAAGADGSDVDGSGDDDALVTVLRGIGDGDGTGAGASGTGESAERAADSGEPTVARMPEQRSRS